MTRALVVANSVSNSEVLCNVEFGGSASGAKSASSSASIASSSASAVLLLLLVLEAKIASEVEGIAVCVLEVCHSTCTSVIVHITTFMCSWLKSPLIPLMFLALEQFVYKEISIHYWTTRN